MNERGYLVSSVTKLSYWMYYFVLTVKYRPKLYKMADVFCITKVRHNELSRVGRCVLTRRQSWPSFQFCSQLDWTNSQHVQFSIFRPNPWWTSCEFNAHRRRDSTRQLSRVGIGDVYWGVDARFIPLVWPAWPPTYVMSAISSWICELSTNLSRSSHFHLVLQAWNYLAPPRPNFPGHPKCRPPVIVTTHYY